MTTAWKPLDSLDAALATQWRDRFAPLFISDARLPVRRLGDAKASLEISVQPGDREWKIQLLSTYTGTTAWFVWEPAEDPTFLDGFAHDRASEVRAERARDGETEWDD